MANKTIVQVPVGLADIIYVHLIPVTDPVVPGQILITETVTYQVEDNAGMPIGGHRSYVRVLSSAEKTQLKNHLVTQVLPDINAMAEGT